MDFDGKSTHSETYLCRVLNYHYDIGKMIDPEMLAAILKELGYLDEDEDKTDKTQSETQENEQNSEQKKD